MPSPPHFLPIKRLHLKQAVARSASPHSKHLMEMLESAHRQHKAGSSGAHHRLYVESGSQAVSCRLHRPTTERSSAHFEHRVVPQARFASIEQLPLTGKLQGSSRVS